MTYKTIGVVVTDETNDLITLKAAMAVARRQEAHLDIYCLGLDPIRYDMAPMGAAPALTVMGTEEAQERAKALEAWANGLLTDDTISSTVQPMIVTSVGLDLAVARIVRYSDLIVASQPYGTGTSQLQINVLEAALFGTGAPVLVIPQVEFDYNEPFDRLLVAWNESDEALEAVRKALPALKAADRAEIVMIDPPSHSPERSDPGGAICVMLARHGIKAEVSILSKTMPRVSEVINRQVQEHDCDMIVMGAYGHSRFREALIGGATREMLETAQVPIMMAH